VQNGRNYKLRENANVHTAETDSGIPTANIAVRCVGPAYGRDFDVISSAGRTHDSGPDDDTERAVLLATKLHVPAVRGQLVYRSALLDTLSHLRRHKLTVLSAPAGWGKTSLLAQWITASHSSGDDRRFCWLSLDVSDNDPVWFWMYAVAALQTIVAEVGTRAVELLAMGADPLHVVLPTLLNDLDALHDPLVLVLDDYQVVTSRAVHEQMAFVVSRIPANLHLVVATRSDPMLPLARLRASGDLAELRTNDLRFAAEEADHLINDVLALNLSQADIQLLQQRTEGWAAGLYLAGLSLVGRPDATAFIKTFAGDNRHIVDYLMAEVLDRQPVHMRSFLLRSSVLKRLSGPLCDAVLHTTGSAGVLEKVEQENLFLVPLDMSRHWYRYHHLFGELLQTELHRSEPELVADLYRRAAEWFEGQNLIDEAVRHLVAAGDIARGAELVIADWVTEFNGGGLSTVSGWLDLLPGQTVSRDPRLSAIRAWIALNTGQFDDARWWIDAVEAGSAGDAAGYGGLTTQLVALREVYEFKTGDITAALNTARYAITLNFDDAPQALSAAYCIYGSTLYFSGSIEEARAAYQRAVQWAEKIGDRRRRIYAQGYLALIAAERGQFTDAEYHIQQATGVGTSLGEGEHFVNAMVSLAGATILDMRGDIVAAAAAARLAVVLARKGAGILEIVKALMLEAKVLHDLGDHEAAEASKSQASALLRRCPTVSANAMPAVTGPAEKGMLLQEPMGFTPGEELTAKELEILRLLATRLSRREIGERLVVSLNTVKTHQRAVYRKLGVQDRDAAVSRARELRLL
jgi:LuxR family maltose regulon positive regulatory protein